MKATLPVACTFFMAVAGLLKAEDYPQLRGPQRDGISQDKGLLHKWPSGGPALLWKTKGLGGGYSSVAVAGGRIYTMGDKGGEDSVIALEEKTGKKVWAKVLG